VGIPRDGPGGRKFGPASDLTHEGAAIGCLYVAASMSGIKEWRYSSNSSLKDRFSNTICCSRLE
jgi:hypothetical protein